MRRAKKIPLRTLFRHWQETFAKLEEPAEQDTDPDAVREDLEDLHYPGPRLGAELPIW